MSERAFEGEAPVRGDWSQVFTDLDWVAHWMAERGYTDAEISYVLERPASPVTPALAAEAETAVEPVEPVEGPVLGVVDTGQSTWIVSLAGEGLSPAAVEDDERAERPDVPESATA